MNLAISFPGRCSGVILGALAAIGLTASCTASDKSVVTPPATSSKGRPAIAFPQQTAAKVISVPPVTVKLAEGGRALLPIVISAQSSEREKTAARTLAAYLKRISGGEFKIETSAVTLTAGTPGIVLGSAAHFAPETLRSKPADATSIEDYILRSHAGGVALAGATDLALEHAVWDFLYRLGYRQFFPGAKWEVVPSDKNLSATVNASEQPNYYARRIWFGYGPLPENSEADEAWNARNRATAGIALNTTHSYDRIIQRNQAAFAAHPEYLTKPGGNKFCVSNPGLQNLIVADSLAQFEKDPELQSISLEPSDGGGWESDSCGDGQIYKSITDRVISLANTVAEAVTQKYPDKYIGIYAYGFHSPPPSVKVHPHVVVSIATGFIRGGYTMDQLFAGWHDKASLLGVREYYGVYPWDSDLPGQSHGSNLAYLQSTLPRFHEQGARFLSAESSDSWGPNGMGYYLASRLMWDTGQSSHVEDIKADFFKNAFGPAQASMAEFYALIDGSNQPLLSEDLVGRMYRQLGKALQSTGDPAICARLEDLALYTRYVELFSAYSQVSGPARQAAFESLMRFSWRIRTTHMVHTNAVWRALPSRDNQVKVPENADYRVPEPKNPWKSSEPFASEQIQKFITDGIANNKLLTFTPIAFSHDLAPVTPLLLTSDKPGGFKVLRGDRNLYTWVSNAPATIALQASVGSIYTNRGDAKFQLYPVAEPQAKSVAEQSVAPDKQAHDIQLKTSFEGLHRIAISDGRAGTEITWPQGTPLTLESSMTEAPVITGGRWTLYFYVPKGTKTVGGYRNGLGGLLDANGKQALAFEKENNPGYWSVPVAPGQDGKLWTLQGVNGQVMLMTVPPYLARSAQELLLPQEVIAADAAQ